jgi:hypothetical protein
MGMGCFLEVSCFTTGEKRSNVGAGDGNRTHDTQLGKLMFYH